MEEIKVRKPKVPKCFGIASIYERYSNRWYKWRSMLPENGTKIKLTWLPNPINHPSETSAYIGMQGTVEDMDKTEGSFVLRCETCLLICLRGNFNYIII